MPHFPIGKILDADRQLKEMIGDDFEGDGIKSANLFEGISRNIHRNFQRSVQLGDPDNNRPVAPDIMGRLISSAAILYDGPATRRLRTPGGELLDDQSAGNEALQAASRRMLLDSVWQRADAYRHLLRQGFLVFSESAAQETVVTRLYEPFNVFRLPTPGNWDLIEEDEAIAFKVVHRNRDHRGDPDPSIFLLWQRDDDGGWSSFRVDGSGAPVGRQPFPETGGKSPFGEILPVVHFYDEPLMGRAWLPIPEHRLDMLLNISALASDAAFIAKMEAHSIRWVKADRQDEVPDKVGPGVTWKIPIKSDVGVLGHSSQLEAVNLTIDRKLSMLALSESLPPDAFAANRTLPNSSITLKIAFQDADRQRRRMIPVAMDAERRAYPKFARVWNVGLVDVLGSSVARLDENLELNATFAATWMPVDLVEHQTVSFNDMSAGLLSPVRYIMEKRHVSRRQAEEIILEARKDLETFALPQNPAAVAGGPNVAGVSATLKPGAFNPDRSSSVEGASLVSAVVGQLGEPS